MDADLKSVYSCSQVLDDWAAWLEKAGVLGVQTSPIRSLPFQTKRKCDVYVSDSLTGAAYYGHSGAFDLCCCIAFVSPNPWL